MIIFRGADGQALAKEDLRGLTGTFQYELVGSVDVPAEARVLHQRGRQAGGIGEYKKALALLEGASRLAPHWPYPVYDTAYHFCLWRITMARGSATARR